MGNCILTKLKGSVNNDNLPIFGEIQLGVDDERVSTINIQADGALRYKLTGNGYFTDSTGTEDYGKETTSSGVVYVKSNESCTVKVIDQSYAMTSIFAVQGAFIHAESLAFRKNTLRSIDMLDNSGIQGSISGEGIFKNLTYFAISDWNMDTPVNINIFNGNTSTDTIYVSNGDKLEGTIESLLESIWNASKRSGSITLAFYGSPNVKFRDNYTFYNGTATFSSAGISVTQEGGQTFSYDGSSWTYPNN